MSKVTIFPKNPFDNMKFVDQWRRRWIYKKSSKSWMFDGFVPDIPIADSSTIGLLSPELKQFVDSLREKAGGFGIITDNSYGRVTSSGYKGVLNGDVKIISDSLDIKCNDRIVSPELDQYPSIDINFSDDFLDTACIEIPGCPGPKGRKGPKGDKGKDGTGNGPQGERGDPGSDAFGISSISDIKVVFDESFYSSAVTDVRLDEERAILSVTRSSALVPDETTPADQVVAQAVIRDIEFNDDTGWDYKIVKPQGVVDPFKIPQDPVMLAYGADFAPAENRRLKVAATGCCCEEADGAEIIAKNLSDYINQIIDKFKSTMSRINDEYDREVREFVFKKDEEARKALDKLVQKLSDEEFHEKFEYCMNLEDNGICGLQCCNELSKMRQDPYNNPGEAIVNALNEIEEKICSCDQEAALSSGTSEIAENVNHDLLQTYGIPTLSENAGLAIPSASGEFVSAGSDFNQFSIGICAFAISILEASGSSSASASDYCADSNTTKLGTITLKPGQSEQITTDTGPALKAGAYIIQYKNGTIFDSDNPTCGYVVGTGTEQLGLVLRRYSNAGTEIEEIAIPWPESSISSNPLDPNEVEEAYLSGPITELSIGSVANEGDRLLLEAVATGDRSHGSIEVSVVHCSKCVTKSGDA